MIKRKSVFFPAIAVSILALSACGRDTEAPQPVNPDAGTPQQEQVETDSSMSEMTEPEAELDAEIRTQPPADLQQQIDEVQRQAEDTFEEIREQTEQTGEALTESGAEMLETLTEEMQAAGETLSSQIDAIVRAAEDVRDDAMTDQQRIEMIANARVAAEQAARTLGHSEAEIAAAGDEAETRVRAALDM